MNIKNHKLSKNAFDPANKQVLETWLLSRVKVDPKHPRKITKKQIEKAERAMCAAQAIPPITVDNDGVIIAGQVWFQAAKNLGVEEVPILIVGTLSKAQAIVYRNAHDKILELGEWDKKNLAEDFVYLVQAALNCEIDFSVEATGFEIGEIDFVMSSGTETETDPADILPETDPQKPVISKQGDLWLPGHHKILCGDSTNEAAYKTLMEGTAIHLISSDFPYNVPIKGFVSGNGAVKHDDFAMGCGEMSDPEFIEFMYRVLVYALVSLEEGGCIYLTIDWRHVDQMMAAAKRCGLVLLNMCVWDKGSGAMGSLYRSQHELVLVYRKGKAQHRNNIMLGKYGRNRTNVWYYPSANMSKEGRRALQDHPTPKPVAMIADIIRDVTKPGDIVLDPFMGGGTTLISAEKTGRICYGIELEPRYVDVCIRRWQQQTGKQAINAKTGLTFDAYEQRLLNGQNA